MVTVPHHVKLSARLSCPPFATHVYYSFTSGCGAAVLANCLAAWENGVVHIPIYFGPQVEDACDPNCCGCSYLKLVSSRVVRR